MFRTLSLITAVTLAASAVAACASHHGDDEADNAGALTTQLDVNKFSMNPGAERIAQHKSHGDVVATQKAALDLKNAYWLARLSKSSYYDEDEAKKQLEEVGLPTDADHFRFWENKCTDTQVIYVTTASLSQPPAVVDNPYNAASKDVAILAYRGTERTKIQDFATDLYVWRRPNVISIGSVHAGFYGAFMSVWTKDNKPECASGASEDIGKFLRQHHEFDGRGGRPVRKGAELYVTGHSLGAALATMTVAKTATEQCEQEGKTSEDPCFQLYTPISGLITFGSPRLGNQEFANTLARWMQDRTPIYRYVQGKDAISNIPGLLGWFHVGFDRNETDFKVFLRENPGSMIIGDNGDRGNGGLVEDHLLPHYLNALEQVIKSMH